MFSGTTGEWGDQAKHRCGGPGSALRLRGVDQKKKKWQITSISRERRIVVTTPYKTPLGSSDGFHKFLDILKLFR